MSDVPVCHVIAIGVALFAVLTILQRAANKEGRFMFWGWVERHAYRRKLALMDRLPHGLPPNTPKHGGPNANAVSN
jgi:hypothetical protein